MRYTLCYSLSANFVFCPVTTDKTHFEQDEGLSMVAVTAAAAAGVVVDW